MKSFIFCSILLISEVALTNFMGWSIDGAVSITAFSIAWLISLWQAWLYALE